jgi:hypothetical protein
VVTRLAEGRGWCGVDAQVGGDGQSLLVIAAFIALVRGVLSLELVGMRDLISVEAVLA